MRIDEYLDSYDRYKNGYQAMYKTIETIERRRFGRNFIFADTTNLKIELRRRERILRHATARMQAAISRLGDTYLANYLICKYLYGMKNSDIAQTFNYCERQIYRMSALAKKRLYIELLKLMPKPRRGDIGRSYKVQKYKASRSA